MLVRLIALINRTMHSTALLYVTYFFNRPNWAHICRVSLVDFYRLIRHPTLTTDVSYGKVIDQTGCLAAYFFANAMYVCKPCFRLCSRMLFKFIITRQNTPEYAISRNQIQFFFLGRGHPLPISPRQRLRRLDFRAFGIWPPLFKNSGSATVSHCQTKLAKIYQSDFYWTVTRLSHNNAYAN